MNSAAQTISEPVGAERRRDARLTLVTKATVFADGAFPPRRVFLSNISSRGVAFRSSSDFRPGQRYRLKVEAGPMALNNPLQVIRCASRPDTKGQYEIGCRFLPHDPRWANNFRRAESVPRNPCKTLRPTVTAGTTTARPAPLPEPAWPEEASPVSDFSEDFLEDDTPPATPPPAPAVQVPTPPPSVLPTRVERSGYIEPYSLSAPPDPGPRGWAMPEVPLPIPQRSVETAEHRTAASQAPKAVTITSASDVVYVPAPKPKAVVTVPANQLFGDLSRMLAMDEGSSSAA